MYFITLNEPFSFSWSFLLLILATLTPFFYFSTNYWENGVEVSKLWFASFSFQSYLFLPQIFSRSVFSVQTNNIVKSRFDELTLSTLHTALVGFRGGSVVKNLPIKQETWVWSLGGKDPLEKEMAPTPVFLPGESHGQRNLGGTVHGVAKTWTQLSD